MLRGGLKALFSFLPSPLDGLRVRQPLHSVEPGPPPGMGPPPGWGKDKGFMDKGPARAGASQRQSWAVESQDTFLPAWLVVNLHAEYSTFHLSQASVDVHVPASEETRSRKRRCS